MPFPAIGIDTSATVLSGLMVVVTGSKNSPVETARMLSRAMAVFIGSLSTLGALTATIADRGSPGKAAWMRS